MASPYPIPKPHGETTAERHRRFFSFVEPGPLGCWYWIGNLDKDRYGKFCVDGANVRAIRWAYEEFVGPIPDGLVLDHFRCQVKQCVNPAHLEPVTPGENALRGDTLAAFNKAKTHCRRGHPFTPENTYSYRDGRKRYCKPCILDRCRREREAAKARRCATKRETRRRAVREMVAREVVASDAA